MAQNCGCGKNTEIQRHRRVRSCFFDEVFGYDIPLLAKAGWREAPGWSLTAKRFEMRFETWRVSDHPVSAVSEASRHFLSGRATPPSQGGECASPESIGCGRRPRYAFWV